MQNLKVTLVQADQIWEDKEANFRNYDRLLTGVDTDLIVLPEMFQTGFSMNVNDLSEEYPEKRNELIAGWNEYSQYVGVVFDPLN